MSAAGESKSSIRLGLFLQPSVRRATPGSPVSSAGKSIKGRQRCLRIAAAVLLVVMCFASDLPCLSKVYLLNLRDRLGFGTMLQGCFPV